MFRESDFLYKPNSHTHAEWIIILEGQGFCCFWCGDPITYKSAEPDHLWPKSRGGSDRKENIVAACMTCNRMKGNLTAEEFIRQRPAFFHCGAKLSTGIPSLETSFEPQILPKMRRESEEGSWAWRNPA